MKGSTRRDVDAAGTRSSFTVIGMSIEGCAMNWDTQVLRQLVEVLVGLVVSDVETERVRHEDVNACIHRRDGRRETSDARSSAENVYLVIPFHSNSLRNCQK